MVLNGVPIQKSLLLQRQQTSLDGQRIVRKVKR